MASIGRAKDKAGKISGWQVGYRDGSGRQRAKNFAKKADASRFRAEVERDLARGEHIDDKDATTVLEYARQYLSSRPYKPATGARYSNYVESHVQGTGLGGQRLVTVKPADVQSWITERGEVLQPETVSNLLSFVRSIFRNAVSNGVIRKTPVVEILIVRVEKEKVTPPTVEEVRRLASAIRADCRAMVLTQAGLGLRIGELLALRKEDVTFLGRSPSVAVEWQIPTSTRQRTRPKTTESRRVIPMPVFVAEEIARHIEKYGVGADGAIFRQPDGRNWSQGCFRDVFVVAVQDAALSSKITTHFLRHHYASVLLAAGESVVAVAARLGHRNANLVLSVYGHLIPGSDDRTRRALDDAWRAVSVHPATGTGS